MDIVLIVVACVAGAVAVYLYATAGIKPTPQQAWLTQWLYAHRGLHDSRYPENSMGAFRAAVGHGYGIELDVHVTSDGEVVVFHDSDLRRMVGLDGSIENMTYDEVRKLRLAGTEEGIPRLADVLEMVDCRVPLLIETKNMGSSKDLEECTLRLLQGYRGMFAVQSFSPIAMRWFRRQAPGMLRGQLSSTFRPREKGFVCIIQFLVGHLLGNFLSRPNFISYGQAGLHWPVVRRLRRSGLPVLAWTIRSAEEMQRVEPLCDTIIFEGFDPREVAHHEA